MITIVYRCDLQPLGGIDEVLVGHVSGTKDIIDKVINSLMKKETFKVGPDGLIYPFYKTKESSQLSYTED